MSAYITSKFNQFTHNRLIRPIIGQSKSTIDFRRIMDRGQILLVNLSKGLLGEKDTSFLGMLVMGKLLSATLSRADTPTSHRRPFYLYVDEFQNFTTGTVTNMLAEARKYGLCLTLAHQNMRQLPVPLMGSVMGNVGTKLLFRIGTNDAPEIESYVKPNLSAQDLLSLPDHHVAGRLLAHNIPTPPFVFRTHPPQHRDAAAARSIGQDVVSHCRKHYTRPMSEVEQEISTRRQAYLDGEFALLEHVLRSSEIILSALGGMKVRTLGQLLATPKNDLIALLDIPAYLALEKILALRNLHLKEA